MEGSGKGNMCKSYRRRQSSKGDPLQNHGIPIVCIILCLQTGHVLSFDV